MYKQTVAEDWYQPISVLTVMVAVFGGAFGIVVHDQLVKDFGDKAPYVSAWIMMVVIITIATISSHWALKRTREAGQAEIERVYEIGSEGLYYAALELLETQKGGFRFHLNGLARDPNSKYHRQGFVHQLDQIVDLINWLKKIGSRDCHRIAELTLGQLRAIQSKVTRSNWVLWDSLSRDYCDRISKAEKPDPPPGIC